MSSWPHSPAHKLSGNGAWMVTAGTYSRQSFFDTPDKLDILQNGLLHLASRYGWLLQAWAVLSNHYHFVALAPPDPRLGRFISHLHTSTASALNRLDQAPGRRVWFQYWDSPITHEKSYLARLNYVHRNAVHHGFAADPASYAWCSAGWFEKTAERAFLKTVWEFPCDKLKVADDF